jgi:salicylate hydroxylase
LFARGGFIVTAQRIVIIGAGIGGLTAAAALRQRGFEVRLLERADSLGEVGAGVQLGPNAVKVARALGVEAALRRECAEPKAMMSVNWDDASLRYREPLREIASARFGAPYLTGHRADLHHLLHGLVPPSWIELGTACVGCETAGATAVARLADGREIEADILVGADGVRSVVRENLFGPDRPRFTQQICWRAMLPIEKVPAAIGPGGRVHWDPQDYCGWIGPTGHVICYPIRRGEIMNIFAGRVSEDWVEEAWAVPSSRDELLAAYAGWNEALLDMFRNVGEVFTWGIFDRDPLPTWTRGRVTLLGDAAHPMMPTLAQGAAITMEDGYALARHLDRWRDDPVAALRAFEDERRPRASQVQLQARTQFDNNRKKPAPPPLSRDWIFAYDAARSPDASMAPA